MPLTDELTNGFGVGSVDFHWNHAFPRVLEMSREQSRSDNNFSPCRSKLAAPNPNRRILSCCQLLFHSDRHAGTGPRAASIGLSWRLAPAGYPEL